MRPAPLERSFSAAEEERSAATAAAAAAAVACVLVDGRLDLVGVLVEGMWIPVVKRGEEVVR